MAAPVATVAMAGILAMDRVHLRILRLGELSLAAVEGRIAAQRNRVGQERAQLYGTHPSKFER